EPVAIVVDSVAGGVMSSRDSGLTAVDLTAVHAARGPGGGARTDTATGGLRDVILVHLAVAVLVDAVADAVQQSRLTGTATVFHHTEHAGRHAAGGACAHAAAGDQGHVVLVQSSVAVVVDTVARCVISSGNARGATIDQLTALAGGHPAGSTGADPAARRSRHEVFVDRAVAVVVDAVAGRIVGRRGPGGAAVHHHTIEAR